MDRINHMKAEIDDLEATLKAVEFVLIDQGYLDPNEAAHKVIVPKSGIRINGKLSFRGKEKTAELFHRLDEDRLGRIGFEEYRSMYRSVCLK